MKLLLAPFTSDSILPGFCGCPILSGVGEGWGFCLLRPYLLFSIWHEAR